MKTTKEYSLSSSGELQFHPDAYKGINEEQATAAAELERDIQEQRGVVEAGYIRLGDLLAQLVDNKLYKALGYATFKQWVDSPEVNIGYSQATTLLRIVRKALPILHRHNAMDALAPFSIMKLLLPVLSDENGEEKFILAAREVQGLTVKDAREKIKEIRGLETDKELTPIFAARVKQVTDGYEIDITRTDSQNAYTCTRRGPIFVRTEDWAIWESRFGRFIHHEVQ